PVGAVPTLDQRLKGASRRSIVADGPACGCRHAGYAVERIVCRRLVRRGDNRPRSPVPSLDEGLKGDAVLKVRGVLVETDGPAVGRRHARHGLERVALYGAGVG